MMDPVILMQLMGVKLTRLSAIETAMMFLGFLLVAAVVMFTTAYIVTTIGVKQGWVVVVEEGK